MQERHPDIHNGLSFSSPAPILNLNLVPKVLEGRFFFSKEVSFAQQGEIDGKLETFE
jgi:hypothetical protein